MKTYTNIFLLSLLLWSVGHMKLQAAPAADSLVRILLERAEAVQSFRADVSIDVDVDFIRMPVKNGRIFYKAPDRFRFRASGFVLLPMRGLNYSVHQMLREPHTAIYSGADSLGHQLKIIPMTAEADYQIASLWVDAESMQVNKMEIISREQGSFTLFFTYGDLPYDLPVASRVEFDMAAMDIPMQLPGNFRLDKSKMDERSRGTVRFTYSNYRINGEIPDEVFEGDDEDSQE